MTRRKARWRARFWGMGVVFDHPAGTRAQARYEFGHRRPRRVKRRLAKKLWKRRVAIGKVILRKLGAQMAGECGVVPEPLEQVQVCVHSRQMGPPLQIDWLKG